MPYVGRETPKLGDDVKNQYEQPGTVIRLQSAQDGKVVIVLECEALILNRRSDYRE